MNRREAIGNIILGAASLAILPQCQADVLLPQLSNMEVSKSAYRALDHLSKIILPIKDLPVTTRESTVDYILTVVDRCASASDLEKFQTGLAEYETYTASIGSNPKRWTPEQVVKALDGLEAALEEDTAFAHFYDTTKGLTKHHFQRSELYMTQYMEYKFVPGPYEGCVKIEA